MAYAFNQLQPDGSGSMTKAEAIAEAERLNRSGSGRVRYAAKETEYGWTAAPAEIAGIESAFGTKMAESVFNPSSPGECRAFCAAATAVTTPLFGDVSGGPSSDQLNMSSNVAARSEKALDLLQQHPNESVAGFAKGLSRAPTPVRYSLIKTTKDTH